MGRAGNAQHNTESRAEIFEDHLCGECKTQRKVFVDKETTSFLPFLQQEEKCNCFP